MSDLIKFISLADLPKAVMEQTPNSTIYMITKINSSTTLGELVGADGYMTVTPREPAQPVDPKPEAKPEPEKKAEAKKAAPKIDHGKIMALHKAGWTATKIADEVGCSVQTVINHVNRDEG